MDDQSLRELRKKKVLIWFGLLFSLLIIVVAVGSGSWLMACLGAVLTIGCIAGLVILRRQLKANDLYRPGKGFWYYRMKPKQKMNYLTAGEILVILLIALSFWIGYVSWYSIVVSAICLYYIQFVIKRRIKLHTPIDDASLFELEELGIIRPEDIVNGLYKDFESWESVVEGSKILVLTPDCLIIIRMSDPENGERVEIKLRQINRLFLAGHGKQGQGLIATVGLTDGSIFRFTLVGESFQDSPEQFVQQLLETIDQLHIAHPSVPQSPSAAPRARTEELPPVAWEHKPVFRQIDFQEAAASPVPDEPSKSAAGQRVLDF